MANAATQFKKGDPRASAAGKRSKRGPSIKNALLRMLRENDEITPDKIAKTLALLALEGSAPHMKMLLEYADGKAGYMDEGAVGAGVDDLDDMSEAQLAALSSEIERRRKTKKRTTIPRDKKKDLAEIIKASKKAGMKK